MNGLINEYDNLTHSFRTISDATSLYSLALGSLSPTTSQSFEYLKHISYISLVKFLENGFHYNRGAIF